MRKIADSGTKFGHGNRLNGGNSDNGGLSNVNNWQSDDRNDNIGFRLQIALYSLIALIQPPSILPISKSWEARVWYLLLSRHLVSVDMRISIFKISNFMLIFCKKGSFSSLGRYPAVIMSSIISTEIWSIFWPNVYLLVLGKVVIT